MQLTLFVASALYAVARGQASSSSSTSSAAAAASTGGASSAAASTTGPSPAAGSGSIMGRISVCFPKMSNGTEDTSSPCFQTLILSGKCNTFEDSNGAATGNGASGGVPGGSIGKRLYLRSLHSNHSLSQECFCKPNMPGSAYWENLFGCNECLRLHGLKDDWIPAPILSAASSSFCAATSPTAGLEGFLAAFHSTATTPSLGTTTATDVLGSSTAISDYFTSTNTPSVTSSTGSSSSSQAGVPAMTQAPWSGVALLGVLGVAVML